MSEETFERARAYARELDEAETDNKPLAVLAIHLITNGWDQGNARHTEASSHAVSYWHTQAGQGFVVWPDDEWEHPRDSYYIMDDGRCAIPTYVTGWLTDRIFLGSFPMDFNAAGEPRMRFDNSGPVDFSDWKLSARRAYHVKVRRDIPALEGKPW